jgi:peptidoglycan/xylan/chitin deacetylase (PgdA/CDA1 family)
LRVQNSRQSNFYQLPDHYRPRRSSIIWQSPPPGWQERLLEAVERTPSNHSPNIFFRADDIGAGGCAFEALCNLFRDHDIPLAMSVVPAWLSAVRQRKLFECAPLDEALWGWHQHGWRHVNWQRSGKKSEFGEHRPLEKQWRDIWQGREKMLRVFHDHLLPVFTPPWNRLSGSTLKILQQLGFKAVSIPKPLPRGMKTPAGLKNLRVQLDLHTRKGVDASTDFQNLLAELVSLLARKEPSGIVIHHQRMTAFALEFIDELLRLLRNRGNVAFMSFQEILDLGNDH